MKNVIYFKNQSDTNILILTVIYITSLLANLTVGYRYINLGNLIQSGGIFIFPISFIISDITTEIYGSHFAKKMVLFGIISQLIFALYATLVIHLPSPDFLQNKQSYYDVFNSYIKFSFAGSISIWLGSWINIVSLSKFSEYVGGKYFALRSFLCSTIGEFVVTVVSMIIANYNRLDIHNLLYMILCCFFVKTIISFFAIWPASVAVYFMQQDRNNNDLSIKNIKNPFLFFKKLLILSWSSRSYIYNLESINLDDGQVKLFFKGTRGNIDMPIDKLVLISSIIEKISPTDSANIGYYCGYIIGKNDRISMRNNEYNRKRSIYLEKGQYNISSISRNGFLNIVDMENIAIMSRSPQSIYKNTPLLKKFTSSQALYIGYLAGKSVKDEKNNFNQNINRLTLVE